MYQYDKYQYNIILGFPRSGTTFLIDCLKALPYSECTSERLLPYPIPHIVNQHLSPDIYEALSFSFLSILFNHAESGEIRSRYSALSKWVKGYLSFNELIEAFYRKRPIKNIVYKEPFLGFAPEYAYNSLPNCRIIHIYRDGRDAADSLVRTFNLFTDQHLMTLQSRELPLGRKYGNVYIPWWVENGKEKEFLACTPYVRAIWMWKEMVRRCHDFFSHPDVMISGRVLLLKYEDLVSEPVKYGDLVVKHCGCRMNKRLQKMFERARSTSIGIYKRRDCKEIEAAEIIAKTELEIYGYTSNSKKLIVHS